MSIEVLPKMLAMQRNNGLGRGAPNLFPTLEEPDRIKWSLNPFTVRSPPEGSVVLRTPNLHPCKTVSCCFWGGSGGTLKLFCSSA